MVVEGEDAGGAGGDFLFDDLVGSELVEHHDECAEAVSVGGDDDCAVKSQGGFYQFFPAGAHTGNRVLERLAEG